ncbi:hypothetical protein [Lactococcus raffinolactis]|uniref:hypothetical protein n=1 Tax=Pseudolactococcus raffinolactis TaxID=1366 RepID=UPI0034CD4356
MAKFTYRVVIAPNLTAVSFVAMPSARKIYLKSYQKQFLEVPFIHQETAVEGTTIEVTPGAAIVTPPVTSQSIPTTNDPAVTTATPSITAKATSTAAPTGAVAKTNHKAKGNTSVTAALLIMSVLTILGTISYKRRENV